MIFLYCLISFVGGMVAMGAFFFAALLGGNGDSMGNIVSTLERTARRMTQEKGEIIYPKSDETIAMEEMFMRNNANGEDTEIGKIEQL